MSNKRFHILTLFPEACAPHLGTSLLKRAQAKGLAEFNLIQIRDFATGKHRAVDDTPYGGGEGMVLRADVLQAAWKSVVKRRSAKTRTILMSPQGKRLDQKEVKRLFQYRDLVLICGHYEGVDERFIESSVDEEISIGDYILTGGELAALVVVDSVTRLIPGVVGNARSVSEETFEGGLLKYPQYTRPPEFEGAKVPEILLSGDHAKIEAWRDEQRQLRTLQKRPDLLSRGR